MAKISFLTRESIAGKKLSGKCTKVLLRISHKSKVVYLDTGFSVGFHVEHGSVIVNFKDGYYTKHENGFVSLNADLDKLMLRYRQVLSSIFNPGLKDVYEIAETLRGLSVDGVASLKQIADEYTERLRKDGKLHYAEMFACSMNDFFDFVGVKIRASDLNSSLILAWKDSLYNIIRYNKKLSESTIGKKLAHVKVLVNESIRRGVEYRVHPFASIRISRSERRDNAVEVDVLRKWMCVLCGGTEKLAHDMWMLSFYTCGMNFCDMMSADWSGECVTYSRRKTAGRTEQKHSVKIPIITEAREIADKYMGDDGMLHLPIHFSDQGNIRYIGRIIRRMRDRIGMPKDFCFYSARKTFAQFCLELGVNDAVVDYLLGHSGESRGVISYYSKVTPKMARIVMERVSSYAAHPELYEEELKKCLFRSAL